MFDAIVIGWTLGNAVNRVLAFGWKCLAGSRGRHQGVRRTAGYVIWLRG
jgi:hypothetical protein